MPHPIPWSITRGSPGDVVTQTELKEHLRIDDSDEDDLIEDYRDTAERLVENELSISLQSQTLILRLDRFPAWEIPLPMPPLISITSIAYTDVNGDSQTVTASEYTADATSTPGNVHPAFGESWPSTRNIPNAVVITYIAGFANAAAVPPAIRSAIMLIGGELYENRERVTDLSLQDLAIYPRLMANHACYFEFEYF